MATNRKDWKLIDIENEEEHDLKGLEEPVQKMITVDELDQFIKKPLDSKCHAYHETQLAKTLLYKENRISSSPNGMFHPYSKKTSPLFHSAQQVVSKPSTGIATMKPDSSYPNYGWVGNANTQSREQSLDNRPITAYPSQLKGISFSAKSQRSILQETGKLALDPSNSSQKFNYY